MALPVNFKDDVLASSMDGKRRYNMITNSDGTVSFEDVTTYSQEGSNFGSAQINNTNGAINTINNNVLDTIEQISANTSGGKFAGALALKNVNNSLGGLKFGKDGDGNYGYYGADDSLIPFSQISIGKFTAVNGTKTINVGFKPKAVIIMSTRAGTFFENVYYYDANNDLVVTGFLDSSSSWGVKSLTPTGFTYKYDSSYDVKYIAFKSNQGFPLKANADNIFK